jgi:hypothetical protein
MWARPLVIGVGIFLLFSPGFHFWLAGSAVLGVLGFQTAVGVHILRRRTKRAIRTD